jgi:hypothetical protein
VPAVSTTGNGEFSANGNKCVDELAKQATGRKHPVPTLEPSIYGMRWEVIRTFSKGKSEGAKAVESTGPSVVYNLKMESKRCVQGLYEIEHKGRITRERDKRMMNESYIDERGEWKDISKEEKKEITKEAAEMMMSPFDAPEVDAKASTPWKN